MGPVLTRMDSLTEAGFRIFVITGDRKGAGTDANVWMRLHDDAGHKSNIITLNHTFKNDHERGETSSFSVKPILNFGAVSKVEVWRDSFGFGHAWFLNRIEIQELFSGELYVFPFHRWVPADQHLFLSLYDCVLPHADAHQNQRREELQRKRKKYRYKTWIPDGPSQFVKFGVIRADTPEKLENDYELQQWRDELVKERHLTGVGLKGVPGQEKGRFTTQDEVIDTVAAIISQCSVAHAAANFQQYEDYAFPPNYPAYLDRGPPKDKRALSEDDVVSLLPSKQVTLDAMIITKLLSSKGTNSLGYFEVQYMYEPAAVSAAEEFREDLKRISDDIKHRNSLKDLPYPYLDPEIVPNSISI
ncbi:lipoxygenase, putative [Ixodes scapularis]|uniref:Lipoxygenase, putative n=1 Tax=Ixodes scapularis TaxID=6945 RepID=B7PB31_IXOSC|nr:lipoxygenase, putative [Ixodes scapularis]|eukprot:XP_002407642.1 lipoxygenase, putative [Ixodes scapularis]